jgi:hypothetical protein
MLTRSMLSLNKKIGFDLDGILTPDVKAGEGFHDVLKYRDDLFVPLFKPQGEWCIITGRPGMDKACTEEWAKQSFIDNPPFRIYHDPMMSVENAQLVDVAVEHKKKWIKFSHIEVYFESSIEQVRELRRVVKPARCEIVHWGSFVNRCLMEACNG